MALLVCTGCTTRYSVGAARCPQCGSTEHVEEGAAEMAKNTVHGGPSNAPAELADGESALHADAVDTAAEGAEETAAEAVVEAAAEEPEQAPRRRTRK